jgi:hypothetical protein
LNVVTLAERKVLQISGDQGIGGGAYRHFEKFGVIGVRQIYRQRCRVYSLARTQKKIQKINDRLAGKTDPRGFEGFSLIR